MLKPNLFFQLPNQSRLFNVLDNASKKYCKQHGEQLVFIISGPLGISTEYAYDGAIILSPGHKIVFLGSDDERFPDYIEDIFDDISALSKKYNYQKYIGRLREWKESVYVQKVIEAGEDINLDDYIGTGRNTVAGHDDRLIKYLITLFTNSINDLSEGALNEGEDLLNRIKNKIILFDADQTRFLYREYQIKKAISVQGLSGTGKTELLLHKLRDIYENGNRVYFTCHNIALANELRLRVPSFFNRMQVTRQIEWNKELWVNHAWGSRNNPYSGLYSYICHHYNLTFYSYSSTTGYEFIFSKVLQALKNIPSSQFKPCFDYILIDENQDFPEVFFEVCKKIVRQKIYTAGDVFQNIFSEPSKNVKGVDISLNRCYRTDPRTLMFAHCLGLGLKEEKRYNWFEKGDWENFGYNVERNRKANTLTLRRQPISRFGGQDPAESVVIHGGTEIDNICRILNSLKQDYPTISPGDVAIIMIDDDKEIYRYMDNLVLRIQREVGWGVIRGHEDKHTESRKLYLTNTNNVKGLEFPFVVCITSRILNSLTYRNKLYTMLTRSFLVTHLVVKSNDQVGWLRELYNDISKAGAINDIIIPSVQELQQIQHALFTQIDDNKESWHDFMEKIFNEKNITDASNKDKIIKTINSMKIDRFDEEKVRGLIDSIGIYL